MIADLKPYPVMKDSGVPWLGNVPEHWEVTTLRRRLRSFDGIKIGPFGSQLKLEQMSESGFKVYGQANVIASDFARGKKFIDQTKFNELSACEIRSGDLVVTMMGTSGRCARVPDNAVPGIMDSHLIRLRTTPGIDRTFAARLIDEAPYVKEQIAIAGKGSIMHGLNSSMIKDLSVACPPLSEQAAIVRFLDHADRRIRRYILAKQKLIKLLEEQKQAIIHRAVTRGLDPNVRLKPSGVEWLGDVPEHWEVRRIKRLARAGYKTFVDGDWIESPFITREGIRLIQTGNIGCGVYREKGFRYISQATYDAFGCTDFPPGDVLICRLGEPVGRACLAPALGVPMITSVDVCILKPSAGVSANFIVHAMSSPVYLGWVNSLVRGSTRDRVSRSMLGGFVVPLPPLSEQQVIEQFVGDAIQSVRAAAEAANREISLLREYRTRLIADVVTGKLDVRDAASRLPDEDVELEPLDEPEIENMSEEADASDADQVSEEAEA